MKSLCKALSEYGEIIIPFQPTNKDSIIGYGGFPDRMIMIHTSNSPEIAKKIINEVLEKFASSLKLDVAIVKTYFTISTLFINDGELAELHLSDEELNKSPIHKINALLDTADMSPNYNKENLSVIPSLFSWDTLHNCYGLSFQNKDYQFPSLRTIASHDIVNAGNIELLNKDQEEYSEADKVALKNVKFKKYHNYIAILHADGDNFGKVISSLGSDKDKIKQFSEQLFEFTRQTAEIIKTYGGVPIYIGGDDIMCFSPVKNNTEDIFSLIQIINTAFSNCFPDNQCFGINVSMSYGLSITYTKYPLNEAIQLSHDLLSYHAKDKDKNPDKRTLSMELMLHSGQSRKIDLQFGENGSFMQFQHLLTSFTDKEEILNSLTQQFIEDDAMLIAICQAENASERLKGYFDHRFNIADKKSEKSNFINGIRSYLFDLVKKHQSKLSDTFVVKDILAQTNTLCRIIKFLQTNE